MSKKTKDKKRLFVEKVNEGFLNIIKEFKNEHGEKYVIFEYRASTFKGIYFITGDELDWELEYQTDKNGNVFSVFAVNKNERKAIVDILAAIK